MSVVKNYQDKVSIVFNVFIIILLTDYVERKVPKYENH